MTNTGKTEATNDAPPRQRVPVSELFFDTMNPRLAESELGTHSTQRQIVEALWQTMAVDEVAWSIATNGYFEYEPLFVQKENGKLVVIEGNRRLAAVKILLDKKLREELRATDLPEITKARAEEISTLPVIHTTRDRVWQYLGYKHVNGPAEWGSFSKADYIARIHRDYKVPLEEIAERIGDRHLTVQRLHGGWVILEQAEQSKVWNRNDRAKNHFAFSHLYTGLSYDGFKQFLGVDDDSLASAAPVPKSKLKNLGLLCVWLYGSRRQNKEPIIKSQNPDLRFLDEVLRSPQAVDALVSDLPLQVAHDISQGDERLFREALQLSKHYLQRCRATMSTGYNGETELLRTAEDALQLADDLCEDMRKKQRPRRGTRAKGGADS